MVFKWGVYFWVGLPFLTQEEIANKLNLTHGRISQIVNDFKTELINKPIVPESLQLFNVLFCGLCCCVAGASFAVF